MNNVYKFGKSFNKWEILILSSHHQDEHSMDAIDFFAVYRKKGFGETLEILSNFKKSEAKQSVFFNALKENKSYLNSFFRVKDDLIKSKMIAYKLDSDNEKVIYLTEKGKELYNRILEIENLIKTPDNN